MNKPKVAIYTLGCKANQYDSEVMKEAIKTTDKYRLVPFSNDAEILVINTCSVTKGADRKSRKYIRKAGRKGELVLVTGCYTTLDADMIKDMDAVDLVFPNYIKKKILEVLDRAVGGFRGVLKVNVQDRWNIDEETISQDNTHTRAFLKIQDGCSNHCSFCKVRFLRGPTRSKSSSRIIEEARKLGSNGFQEVVLTGINITEYGKEGSSLSDLIRELVQLEEISRIRLSSINPAGITDELIELFDRSEKTCPHFHIPLQSGSDKILNAMHRNYDRSRYLKKAMKIKDNLSKATLGTDVMVGFPGETKTDHQRTKELLRQVGFVNCHVFRYSPRQKTAAAGLRDDVHSSVKKSRAKEIRDLVSSISRAERKEFEDYIFEMILEEPSDRSGGWRGYSQNYLDLHLSGEEALGNPVPGQLLKAKVVEAKDDFCLATVEPESLRPQKRDYEPISAERNSK